MKTETKKRRWNILNALLRLEDHSGSGTPEEIANMTSLNVVGVLRTLRAQEGPMVRLISAKRQNQYQSRWRLIRLKSRKMDAIHRAFLREADPQ